MVASLRDVKVKATAVYLLSTAFVCPLVLVVDAAKVGDNDRNREGDHQHATQGADGAEDLPSNCLWDHVSITRGDTEAKL